MDVVFEENSNMAVRLLSVAVILWLMDFSMQDQCSKEVIVSVHTMRTQTGHWHTYVGWNHKADAVELDNQETRRMILDLNQRIQGCSELGKLSTELRLTIPPQLAMPGYAKIPGVGKFKFHSTPANWYEARDKCSSEGGYLTVIRSKRHEDIVTGMFARHPKFNNATWDGAAWMGVHDQYNEGDFLTVLGDSFHEIGYANWDSGKPDNKIYDGRSNDSDCVGILRKGNLIDLPCDAKYAFVCEQELH